MGKYIDLVDSNFEENTQKGVALVDFWAPWCGPCRMITPVIEELAQDYEGKAKICKINTDDAPDLAVKFGVRSIPTIVVLKDGEVVDTMVGVQSKAQLAEKIDKALG